MVLVSSLINVSLLLSSGWAEDMDEEGGRLKVCRNMPPVFHAIPWSSPLPGVPCLLSSSLRQQTLWAWTRSITGWATYNNDHVGWVEQTWVGFYVKNKNLMS